MRTKLGLMIELPVVIDLRELVGFAGNGGEEVGTHARRGLCTKRRERVCVMRWIARCKPGFAFSQNFFFHK